MRDGWKNNTVLYGNKRQEKKKGFFQGEVFFLLTRPLMGNPSVFCLFLRKENNRNETANCQKNQEYL